ncbi:hypothetical protein VaNZ11_000228 [Volvox africanus]|uniref:Elongator complex protein 1 n=1 Tax=Volvox africanus TaxID=51714 RepID=A0ABQ5RLI8_9CHLO|nr:hypothetical protein VaNZ11_000228 [Volvox africanus]
MKNLVIEQERCFQLAFGADGAVTGFCLNSVELTLYIITNCVNIYAFPVAENPTPLWRCSLGPELLTEVEIHSALQDAAKGRSSGGYSRTWLASFSHVLELDALCIATRSGKIVLLHVEEGSAPRLEEVGSIDGGVACVEWSPDGELLAILSCNGNLLVMNQAWELLFEGSMFGCSTASAAAAAAAQAEGSRLFQDARLSWRGDGKFFAIVCRDPTMAVGTPAPSTMKASGAPAGAPALPPFRVRIWDRSTLELHAVCEAVEGLIPLPAWQPNGRHLYVPRETVVPLVDNSAGDGSARTPVAAESGASILLYERNGLRHGDFRLPTNSSVWSLAWSCDSELLAVVIAPHTRAPGLGAVGEISDEWTVQLWHRSNWHWYLKHERRYPNGVGPGTGLGPQLRWDEQHGGVLHVLTPGGLYETLSLVWDTCISERGTAVVVDGRYLLLTPLQHGLVPPPMCAARVALPEAAVDVSISSLPAPGDASTSPAPATSWEDQDEVVAALTASGRLLLARSVEEDLWQETLEDQEALMAERKSCGACSGGGSSALLPAAPCLDLPIAGGRRTRAVCWLYGSSSLLVLASPYPEPELEDGAGDVLVQVDVEWVSCGPGDPNEPRVSPDVRITEYPPVYAGGRVLRMAPHTAGGVAVQLSGGEVMRFTAGASTLVSCGPVATLKGPCPVVRSTPAPLQGAAGSRNKVPPLLGLSRSGMLCWGSTVIVAADVTSIAVRARGPGGPALLYTTRKNLLYTVLMSQLSSYTHRELTADRHSFRSFKREGEMQAAMHAAMRPDAATAASRDVAVRAVEAGAMLVACPCGSASMCDPGSRAPADSSERLADAPVVLQMPRGNLEGVSPRALVLAALVGALRRRDFAEAFRLACVQRVDLNLLVDYGWPSFLTAAASFVAVVSRPSDLCDLLFALRPGSVLAEGGAYAGALAWLGDEVPQPAVPVGPNASRAATEEQQQQQQQQREATAKGPAGANSSTCSYKEDTKVTAVCRAIREAVLALPDAHKYLQVVVTSYARSDPPHLEDAMRCIRDAKERELAPPALGVSTGPEQHQQQVGHSGPADKALKHLLLYADADELYNTALGMYDMPLAYMVVVNAQKDPGEYLSELQRFAAISPPALQRHALDMSLRRYSSALRNLAQAGPQHFEQALQLARERGLMRQLLKLYEDDLDRRPVVLDAYGEHLETLKRYEDAALSYMAAGRLEKALHAYRSAGRWRMVFVVAGQLEYDEAAVQSLAADVVEELVAGGQAADAAEVLLSYLGDVDNSVRTYTQAREWREAMRVSYAHGRSDLVETVVVPAAADGAAALLADARESEDRIRKYIQRLKDVRARRLAMTAAVAAAEEDGAAHGMADDLLSDVVSLVSGLSIYTDATAQGHGGSMVASGFSASSRAPSTVGGRKAHRQGKKLQKAGTRIRQGSPLEEASLVSHVHGLAPRAVVLEQAGQLGELLVVLGHQEDARTLQRAIASWQAAYQEAREDMAANPVPVNGPPHARAEMERLLKPAEDTSSIAWKWEVLRELV